LLIIDLRVDDSNQLQHLVITAKNPIPLCQMIRNK